MNKTQIDLLLSQGSLRRRSFDSEKIKSMIEFSESNAQTVKKIILSDENATIIFRELYESIRQLGEASWWIKGYEPSGIGSHTITLDILKELDIKEKTQLNYLERFKKIRHDANYRGIKVLLSHAEEIISFWDKCSKDIIKEILKYMK